MTDEISANETDDTREKLLAAALVQFADRGFYGASIAQIAGEVGLTKQALLYHFRRKEDLYGEMMKGIATRLLAAVRSGIDAAKSPEQQFEDTILAIYRSAQANPLDTKLLMREMVDNQRRDTPPEEWFFKKFLEEIVDVLDQVKALSRHSRVQKFARVYLAMSAIQYYSASASLLTRFYGEDGYAEISDAYPEELRAQIDYLLTSEA